MAGCGATIAMLGGGVTLHCVLPNNAHFLRGSAWSADPRWHLAVVNGTPWMWQKDSLRPVKFQGVRLPT